MSFLSNIGHFFANIGKFIAKGFTSAQARGLTDAIVKDAIDLVKVAATKFVDNGAKREWVVELLIAKGIPESIARLAVELAVSAFKADTGIA